MFIDARKTQPATFPMMSKAASTSVAARDPNLMPSWNIINKYFTSLLVSLWLTACTPVQEPAPPEPTPQSAPQVIKILSAKPIKNASKKQILFAQSALNKLGYRVGPVDGIWGPWSAREIRNFETQQKIETANGFLSELNLDRLAKESGLDTEAFASISTQKKDIASKLDGKLADTGPQLVIVEKDRNVFIEANPYSEKIQTLKSGTGIYVISEKEGWYEVELINRKKGYIQSN